MGPGLPQATAEQLVRAAEGVHVLGPEASLDGIARFLDGTPARAQSALEAAEALGFVTRSAAPDTWTGALVAGALAASNAAEKTVLVRLHLERFRPYAVFRARIAAGEHPKDAARQACVSEGLTSDPLDAEETLLNWALYSQSLVHGPERELLVPGDDQVLHKALAIQEAVATKRDTVLAHITQKLGVEAAGFAAGEALDGLVESYLTIIAGGAMDHAMFQLGKGLEAWFKKLPELDPDITLPPGAMTMGAIANSLRGHGLTTRKHHALLLGVIAVRNAADHAADADIGATWAISRDTALATSHLAWSTMRSVFAGRAGDHRL